MLNTFIRRSILVSGWLVGASLLIGSPAFASTTETVPLTGTVSSTLDLTATPTATAANLPLDGAAAGTEQIQQVAGLNIHTNNTSGYTLTVSSGNLTGSRGGTIGYQVAVVNKGAQAASGDFTVTSGNSLTYATNAANAAVDGDRDLYIRYTPAALQNPGTYSSTITLTVADNQ